MKGKSLLFGLLSGALLGVLFAPDSGKKLREKFKQERKKGGTGLDTMKKSFMDLGNDIWETVDSLDLQEKASELQDRAAEGKEKITNFVKKKLNKKK